MAWIDVPTEEEYQGILSVGRGDNNKVLIWIANQHYRVDLTVDEAYALINALNVQIQAVINRESLDND